MIPDPITRFIQVKDVVTHFKVLKTAAEECDDYDWMRAGVNAYICQHGEQIYPLLHRYVDGVLSIACGCPAWQFAKGNDGCKHVATYLKRTTPPQKPITEEIARDLIQAGWTGGKGNLQPPETTSDEEGNDNEGSDPTPAEPPKREPVAPPGLGEKVFSRTCPHCDERIEGTDLDDVKRRHREHITGCPENPANKATDANTATVEPEQKQEEENKMAEQEEGEMHDTTKERVKDALDNMPIGSEKTITSIASKRVQHNLMIKGISPRLQEIGRIAVGEKGGRSKSGKTLLPTKLDHFIFTTLDKDDEDRYIRDPGMMEMFGDNCTEIPIRLLYNDIELNFPTFYAKYAKSGIKLRGDGENWTVYGVDAAGKGTREEVFDPNNEKGFLDDQDVKPHGILSVLVEGQNSVGGVFKFRTTSRNSINNILSSLAMIKNMCGMLTYIPLKLVLRKKEVQPVGMSHKTWIPVVSVEFRGSIEELQTQAIEVRRLTSGTQREEMRQIEAAVRDHLDEDETIEAQKDVASEFAPGVV